MGFEITVRNETESGPQDLVTWVYQQIKKMILEGTLRPGEKIKQNDLANQLGVSRTPVIRALQKLTSENLVSYRPRRGFSVRRFTADEMRCLHRLREACEGVAAYDACERATDDEIKALKSLFIPFLAVKRWTPELVKEYEKADREFHRSLVRLSGNPFLLQVLEASSFLHLSYQPGLLQAPWDTLGDHMEIIRALEARDPQRAREAMERHLRLGRENIDFIVRNNEANLFGLKP